MCRRSGEYSFTKLVRLQQFHAQLEKQSSGRIEQNNDRHQDFKRQKSPATFCKSLPTTATTVGANTAATF